MYGMRYLSQDKTYRERKKAPGRTSEEVFTVTLYKQGHPGDLKERMKLFPLGQMSFPRFQIRFIILKISSNQNVKILIQNPSNIICFCFLRKRIFF